MKLFKCAVALSFAVLAVPQAFACFIVYNRANQTVYSNIEPPIDMSYQIHERLPAVFPGGHMVFGVSSDCPSIDARRTSPQLTNVSLVTVKAPAAARSSRMSQAARNREIDALTK